MLGLRVPMDTESAFEEICKKRRTPKGKLLREILEEFLAKNNAASSVNDREAA